MNRAGITAGIGLGVVLLLAAGPAGLRAASPAPVTSQPAGTKPADVVVIKTEGQSLSPPVLLPDGQEFRTWQPETKWTHTLHVACDHPSAGDDNPGTADRPLRTIGKAAAMLQPGQRVVIHGGVYRERVRPARGGTGPGAMIGYEAAAGEQVSIRGSRVLKEKWSKLAPAGGAADCWQADLPPAIFDVPGENPFREPNVTDKQFDIMPWAHPKRGKKPYTLPRGLVFQDGQRLIQVHERADVAGREGSYWVDREAGRLILRPRKDADPNRCTMEVTVQGMIFAPEAENLGWIALRGLTIEHAGNQFPMPQQGALSTMRGHHWLIEGCTVRHANGCGIDIGIQAGWTPLAVGWHLVRRNTVSDCGVCGIAGIRPDGSLIEFNRIERNAWHDVETYYETGGIKTHINRSVVLRGNLIRGTARGPGIWMDWQNVNSRCTGNIVLDTTTIHGAIFIEGSTQPNLVDSNLVLGTRGNAGIYEHDCRGQTFAHNLVVMAGPGPALLLRGIVTDRRVHGERIAGGEHAALNNVLLGKGKPVDARGPASRLEGNASQGVEAVVDAETMTLTLKWAGPPPACNPVPGLGKNLFGGPADQGGTTQPGPLPSGDCPLPIADCPLKDRGK